MKHWIAPGMCETGLSLEERDGPNRWLCVIAGYEGHDDDGTPVDRWITLGTYSDSARFFGPMRASARLTSREARRVGEALLEAAGFANPETAALGDLPEQGDHENPRGRPRLTTITASEVKRPPRRRRWGQWSLTRSCELIHADTGYGVDLERCLSSAQVLDWICQVTGKRWATPEVIGQLVAALDEVLHPQATLCSCGTSRHLTAADVRERVRHHLDAE